MLTEIRVTKKGYMHASRTPLIAILLLVICQQYAFGADRPDIYGYAPAVPLSRPLFVPPGAPVRPDLEAVLKLELVIEKDGTVKKLSGPRTDSTVVNYGRGYLESLKFAPAQANGKLIKSTLPVNMRIQPGVSVPDFYFPVDTNGNVADLDLFVDATKLLGVEPPRVLSFPSYSCDLQSMDSMIVYPYVLLHIELDKSGKTIGARIDTSTFQSFAQQILSAVRYATFEPARVKNKKISSEAYLLVSFFPQVSYPNRGWSADTSWHAGLLERSQVRLLPVKLGLMSKPLPRRVPGDSYPLSRAPLLYGRISASLEVDSLGYTTSWRLSKLGPRERKQAIALVKTIRFFPAVNFDGTTKPFNGLTYLSPEDNTIIRINFDWLPTAGF